MAITDGSLASLYAGVETPYALNLAATDATLEFAAAVTGFRVVVLGCSIGASGGAWTIGFLSDTTALSGNLPMPDGSTYDKSIGEIFIRGASGEAGIINCTRTGGELDGFILYGYERA